MPITFSISRNIDFDKLIFSDKLFIFKTKVFFSLNVSVVHSEKDQFAKVYFLFSKG